MASVCIEHYESLCSPSRFTNETAFPPIENQSGDIIFTPTQIAIIRPVYRASYRDERQLVRALSITIVVFISVIVWLKGGGFMYYIPLYLALMPIIYWISKIGFAFAVARFSEVKSISYCRDHKDLKPYVKHLKKNEDLLDATLDFLKEKKCGGSRHDN
ncbi:hypothetical protein ACLIKC_09945 [Klebsiella aerogenes]|uniref:hypothetical protein n=1 Tax=Klebsiella aerogenes TaxID=548 RepID=UPI003A936294